MRVCILFLYLPFWFLLFHFFFIGLPNPFSYLFLPLLSARLQFAASNFCHFGFVFFSLFFWMIIFFSPCRTHIFLNLEPHYFYIFAEILAQTRFPAIFCMPKILSDAFSFSFVFDCYCLFFLFRFVLCMSVCVCAQTSFFFK